MKDLPDMGFEYQPPVTSNQYGNLPTDDNFSELLSENIARLEALKLRVIECGQLSGEERLNFFHELDMLRGAFVQITNTLSQRTDFVSDQHRGVPKDNQQKELVMEGILGRSKKILRILNTISKMAPSGLTILLEGETGVGKELFARIIHINSNRSKFVALNCGAFPADLIESELFGHVRGAFTGASVERKGKFDEADGGTIFLDEIGELDLSAQVKLLRVLEVGEIQRVGSDKTHRVDVRVVAASNRNLEMMVKTGAFREDLLYRLNMCPMLIPPLRERRDEIHILFEYFLQESCAASNRQVPVLATRLKNFLFKQYSFPGNIRELKNLAYYVTFIAAGTPVEIEDLPDRYMAHYTGKVRDNIADEQSMINVRDDAERRLLEDLLQEKHGNIVQVCEVMQLSRSRVYQLLQKHNLQATDYR